MCRLFFLSFFALILFAKSISGVATEVPPHETLRQQLLTHTDVLAPLLQSHPVNWVYNREAVIPPQCYTKTEGQHNPCYVCHQNARRDRENTMNDGSLQTAYSFSDEGMTNHWGNLFKDRRSLIATISDNTIVEWIRQDNYSELPVRLKQAKFQGWIPDLNNLHQASKAFDKNGLAKDHSGWVAFNYKPFPSTFWPTNGNTDDVMIRLPGIFQKNNSGQYSHDIYFANLAILEANIKGFSSIDTLPIDENIIGKDLNRDGKLNLISQITDTTRYVGKAFNEYMDTYLYPKGTEFLHTVRYLDFDKQGLIIPSTRIKEVRYMRKWKAYPKAVYARQYQLEAYEKEAGHLPGYHIVGDYGLDNGSGWAIQGFIEDANGQLRQSTFEENLFCMGCHNTVGSTIDKTFSFARKIDGAAGWGYINLLQQQDTPAKGESQGEYLTYFERAGGGDEFRSNEEMLSRWFDKNGQVKYDEVQAATSIYELITPSHKRALELNKAYKTIVDEQSYIYGRDVRILPAKNVYNKIDNATAPTLPTEKFYEWDILLQGKNSSSLN